MRGPINRRLVAAVLAAGASALLLPALSVSAGAATVAAPAANATAHFTGHGSIAEAYVLGATKGQHLILANSQGNQVGTATADKLGTAIFRTVKPGSGYQVRAKQGNKVVGSKAFTVLSTNSTPPASFYSSQKMHAGLNYITMRDGVKLAATVRLPFGKKSLTQGPFPTVIEDSGYPIAGPSTLIKSFLGQGSTNPKLLPTTATAVGSAIAPLIGFATVSLQMRGTGCSGGAFDLFGLPSTYDGYDAVQIVGSQPWVLHHKVGLVGISFSGISQLFVAGTDPPDLAAAAPMSATNDLYTTGYPGGMFNSGFAGSWISARITAAKAAPTAGEEWAKVEIETEHTQTCLANQALHPATQTIAGLLGKAAFRTPALYDQRSPDAWAAKIKVPVYIAGALEDEQTGPQWPALISAMKNDPHVFATMVNGTHADSLGPAILSRWLEFLDIFVAGQVPHVTSTVAALSGALYTKLADAPAEPLPAIRFTTAKSAAAAKADFEKTTPRVRVLMDNGGGATPGALAPEWEQDFTSWPPSQAVATTYDLGAGGTLSTSAATTATSVSFKPTPTARPATSLPPTQNAWAALPAYDWAPVTGTEGLGFVSAPLAQNLVSVGPASLNLMLKSSAPDTDLEATVTEVYPTGKEMYITSGFLRAEDRTVDPNGSTATHPVLNYLKATAKPLPSGKYSLLRIPIDPLGFAFRAGSRIRIVISAPGGTRPAWSFSTPKTNGQVTDTVELGGAHPSSLVLSVIPNVTVPDAQPACPSLRGEPCRTYVPAGNGG